MIYSLHGKLIVNENNFFVVECGQIDTFTELKALDKAYDI